jgi:hypothetical protein
MAGNIYRMHSEKQKLKKYYYTLIGKELYCKHQILIHKGYRSKKEEKHKKMINLTGSFLKDEEKTKVGDEKVWFYPFTLVFPNAERTFYLTKEEEKTKWVEHLKKVIGY